MKKNRLLWLIGVLLSGLLITACGEDDDDKKGEPTQEVFAGFPSETGASGDSGKKVYARYTTDGETVPTKTAGETAEAEYVKEDAGDLIWKANISDNDNVRFVFYVSDGTLEEANGRLAPDGFYQSWTEGESQTDGVEAYHVKGDCTDDNQNLCFADNVVTGKPVYAGILFDTWAQNSFVVYTTDGSEPSRNNANATTVLGGWNRNEFPYRIHRLSIPLEDNVKFVFYIGDGNEIGSAYARIGPGGQTDIDADGYTEGDASFSSANDECTDVLPTDPKFCGGGDYINKLPTQVEVCPTEVPDCGVQEVMPRDGFKRINLGIDDEGGRPKRIFVYYTTDASSTTVSRDAGEHTDFVEGVFQEIGNGSGIHTITREGAEFKVIRADIPENTSKYVAYLGSTTAKTANARLAKDGYQTGFMEGMSTDDTASNAYFEGTDCAAPANLSNALMDSACRIERAFVVPVMASYDADATPSAADATVPSGKRRVHAPFPFDTTGVQPFVVYVMANTWTPGSCSDTSITDEANCTGSNTWTAASCSDSSLTTQEACEPLPRRDLAAAKWAPMIFGNFNDPYRIWVADIPEGDNIRFTFLIGQGLGDGDTSNEANHKPNLSRAFGRLANDAYREFVGNDVITEEGAKAFEAWGGDGEGLETYFSGALSGRPDCSTNDPTMNDFCLALKVSPAADMKQVYLGFLFDTGGVTVTVQYTTDGSEPSKTVGTPVSPGWYGGLKLFGSESNRVWQATLPDNDMLKFTVYVTNTSDNSAAGRLSRKGYQAEGSYTDDGAEGVAFDNVDCQTTMQAERVAQEYRLCNANNVR